MLVLGSILSVVPGCSIRHAILIPAIAPHRLSFAFSDPGWELHSDAPWWGHVDMRDLLNLFHPLVVSANGAWAGAVRDVVLPSAWGSTPTLRFYCADNYAVDPKYSPGAAGVENYPNHRFKQALIGDQVVWEQDVADSASHEAPTLFSVDLRPYVRPGQPFRLTLRVIDRVSTEKRLPGDVRFIGGTWYSAGDGRTEQPPRFHTAVWFGDVVLGEAAAVAAAPLGSRPHEAVVAARHEARGRVAPRGGPPATSATLNLLAPTALPDTYPVEGGIPIPPASLWDVSSVRLFAPDGHEVPVQVLPTAFWPDRSIRWLTSWSELPRGAKPNDPFTLRWGEKPPMVMQSPKIEQHGTRVSIETGTLSLGVSAENGALLDSVSLPGSILPSIRNITLRMSVMMDGKASAVACTRRVATVVEKGPVAAILEIRGSLDVGNVHVGSMILRASAIAGSPMLGLSLRVINEMRSGAVAGGADSPALEVQDLALIMDVPGNAHAFADHGGTVVSSDQGLELSQEGPDEALLVTGGERASYKGKIAGWMATDTVEIAGWRFAEQFPKAIHVDGQSLEVVLFRPSPAMPLYRPRLGEAKRHDMWLRFSRNRDDDGAFASLVNDPPRLFDATWFACSGALGVIDPHWFSHEPDLARWVAGTYGAAQLNDWPGGTGIRDFGDAPYRPPQWLNGYWAMVQGGNAWALAGGDPRWLARGHEVARHLADVDSVHLPVSDADFGRIGGSTCVLCPDHSQQNARAQWSPFQAGSQLLLDAWMTGDRESLSDGIANADYLERTSEGVGSPQVREQTRPIWVLLRAWETTMDARYLSAAHRYLDLDAMYSTVVDRRRGAYVTPTYVNWWVVSPVLDALYVRAVDEYYRSTGDVAAAQLEVAIADSVYAEAMLPQEDAIGSFIYYPRYDRSPRYYACLSELFHIAFDLTLDRRFLRAARAAFARYLIGKNADGTPSYQPVGNFGWVDPELGGWMQEMRDVQTAPFTVRGPIPDPDPAAFEPKDPDGASRTGD